MSASNELQPILENIKKIARVRALVESLEMSEEEIQAEIKRLLAEVG
jgi:hypothetical protein